MTPKLHVLLSLGEITYGSLTMKVYYSLLQSIDYSTELQVFYCPLRSRNARLCTDLCYSYTMDIYV